MINFLVYLIAISIIGGLTWTGYRRGILRMVSIFVCFFLASLFSRPFAGFFSWLIQSFKLVPLALTFAVGWLLAGLIIYGMLQWLAHIFLTRVELDRKRHYKILPVSQAERYWGGFVGFLWGSFLVLFLFSSIHFLGSAEELVANPSQSNTSPAFESETFSDTNGQLVIPVKPEPFTPTTLARLKETVDHSPVSFLVRKVDPLNESRKVMIRDVNEIIDEPDLREKFVHHPQIETFAADPRIKELTEDATIRQLVQEKNYTALLNNVKVAALIHQEDLIQAFYKIDMAVVIRDVKAKNHALKY